MIRATVCGVFEQEDYYSTKRPGLPNPAVLISVALFLLRIDYLLGQG